MRFAQRLVSPEGQAATSAYKAKDWVSTFINMVPKFRLKSQNYASGSEAAIGGRESGGKAP